MSDNKKILARFHYGAGGSWFQAETEFEAVTKLLNKVLRDWNSLVDIKSAIKSGLCVDLYEDDTYVRTILVKGQYVGNKVVLPTDVTVVDIY